MNKKVLKAVSRIFITIFILECLYLFVLPPVLHKFVNKDYICSFTEKNTNIKLKADELEISTYLKPAVKITAKNISAENKITKQPLLSAVSAEAEIPLLPLIFKNLNFKHFYADNLQISILKNEDGSFNFENLFLDSKTSPFKIKFKDFTLKAIGAVNTNTSKADFDINIKYSEPFSYKNFSENNIKGGIIIYGLDLKELSPVFERVLPDFKTAEGLIDYIQISAEKKDGKNIQTVINTQFKDILYSQKGWKNDIYAAGENKISLKADLFDNVIAVDNFQYNAEKADVSAYGKIEIEDKPVLDINVLVKNTKTESIMSILPPDLIQETMIIEKIKECGIYGDMEGEAKIQGRFPHPDITGFAKGSNISILDEKTQKMHTASIDIEFNKRILDMKIKVDTEDAESADISGSVYMYREGINDIKIKTSKKLPLKLASKLASAVSRVFILQLGPLPDMDITKGEGVLDLDIKASPDYINLNGFFNFKNADFTHSGIFGKASDVKGSLEFKGSDILIKTDKAFIQNTPVSARGLVKINDSLNFDVSAADAPAENLLETVNKSPLLKDVKKGIALFNKVSGNADLFFNITAKIVPVPFGQPPLPPEEAFEDMRIKGYIDLKDVLCFIEGFKTPFENINGRVNFTENTSDFKDINAFSGLSLLNVSGSAVNDIKTKIPEIDITAEGSSLKAGDTIRFLAESTYYPEKYPDLSPFYTLDSEHDLHLEYKAKSADFQPDKIYAVINLHKPSGANPIKTESGRITVKNAGALLENINGYIFNSRFNISGSIKNIDKINPVYNVSFTSKEFYLKNLGRLEELKIIPEKAAQFFKQFSDYTGVMNFKGGLKNNVFNASADVKGFSFINSAGGAPLKFDNFSFKINDDKLSAENITANIGNIPVFGSIKAEKIYTKPYINGYITGRLADDLIKSCLPENISGKVSVSGDINFSAKIKGQYPNLEIKPEAVLYPGADASISGFKLGDSADKRVFSAGINISENNIDIKNLDYYKYITTQNNTVYPALFAYGSGILALDKETGIYEPQSGYIKIEKTLPAKVLNIFLDKHLLKQGTVTCDLKYENGKLNGVLDAKNIDIPIADAVIKNIKLSTDENDITVRLFSFMNDSVIKSSVIFDNDIKKTPHIDYIKLEADKIDAVKLLSSLSNAGEAFNIQLKESSLQDLSKFQIEKGSIRIDELAVKTFTAKDVNGSFSIDKNGSFKLQDINASLNQGTASGSILYNFNSSDIETRLDFNNVDADYIAKNLFDAENQIYGTANASFFIKTKGSDDDELIKNMSGFAYFDLTDARMPKLGSLEYLLRAGNIIQGGVTGFTLNNVLELLNLVKTGYFSNINGTCTLNKGRAENIEIFSQGENLSLYLHGSYNIASAYADMEILGRVSDRISTIFGPAGNASLNSFFKHIPGISMLDLGRKDFINNTAKIPPFTNGNYEARTFHAVINGDINSSKYVQSFKWVK